MKQRFLLLFLMFAGLTLQLNAQVAAPNLTCVTNDTLVWQTPTNTCGAFEGYEIYASQDPEGPYTLLTTITNPGQTSFFHAGVNGMHWYYYMQSDFNCPGQPVLSSDTLDNRIPEAGPLRYVTVNGSTVEVAWDPSPSPEVIGYIVSRNTMSGTTTLDTIYNGSPLLYVDTTADPEEAPETYFVVSIDACGNKSLVTPPHNTIFLTVSTGNGCNGNINLTWNPYQNWIGGVEAYEIWVSINGGPQTKLMETSGNATTAVIEESNDNDNYCFFIRARQTATPVISNSNITCVTPDVVQAVNSLLMENATYTAAGNIEWQWSWNTTAAIRTATLQQAATSTSTFTDGVSIPVSFPLPSLNTLVSTDMPLLPGYYRMRTVDSCDRAVVSNVVRPPRLLGSAGEGSVNTLLWSAYLNDSATVTSYEIYRTGPLGESLLTTVSGDIREYVDVVDFSGPQSGTQCYYVVAIAEVRLPDGTTRSVRSRSNTLCLEQVPGIYIPNVFAPEGINSTFRPYLQFGDPARYRMAIYDRWGGEVFISENFSLGWNGERNGKPMPQGVYVYHIRIEQATGKVIEKTGSVALLR